MINKPRKHVGRYKRERKVGENKQFPLQLNDCMRETSGWLGDGHKVHEDNSNYVGVILKTFLGCGINVIDRFKGSDD